MKFTYEVTEDLCDHVFEGSDSVQTLVHGVGQKSSIRTPMS